MSDYEDETIQEFLVESAEALDGLDASFVALETNPDDKDQLSAAFRTMHTIKGSCGFLGFGVLETVAHKGENLLSMLRDEVMTLDVELTDALLATVDRIRDCLDMIATTQSDAGVETDELVAQLVALANEHDPNKWAAEHHEEPVAPQPPEMPAKPEIPRIGDILVEENIAERLDVEIAATEQSLGDDRRIGEILSDQGVATPEAVEEAGKTQRGHGIKSDTTIRVDVVLLDDLMNLVGELVLARNEILQHVGRNDDADLSLPHHNG